MICNYNLTNTCKPSLLVYTALETITSLSYSTKDDIVVILMFFFELFDG